MFSVSPSSVNDNVKKDLPVKNHLLKIPKIIIFFIKRNVIIFISFLLFSGFTIYYINTSNVAQLQPYVMHLGIVENNISCHYENENDALPSAEDMDFIPKPNSIFFHETSCRGGLNSRQACAIESAARAHPDRQVYVLFSGPISDLVYQGSSIAILRRLPNVMFARVHITDYAKNTPLEAMLAKDPFNKTQWRVEHSSDVLRCLTLYKWGGLYLDTDVLIVKSLTPLGYNWVTSEDNVLVSNGAMAISMDHIGRKLADAYIHEIGTTYRPDIWGHNGPRALTTTVFKICNITALKKWSNRTCKGLEIFGPEYFYPLHYCVGDQYFKPGELMDVENAYAHHLWNKITHEMKIEHDSPYEKMAQKFCPAIYTLYGEEFGS